MRYFLLNIIAIVCGLLSQAQPPTTNTAITQKKAKKATTCLSRKEPAFPGGDNNWSRYVSENVKLPKDFNYEEDEAGGAFYCHYEFEVRADGSTCNVTFPKGVHPVMEKMVTDMVLRSPKWLPASNGCKAITKKVNKFLRICLRGNE